MKKLFKILGAFIGTIICIAVLALVVSAVMSPPWAGKAIAEKHNLPYHAVVAHRGASFNAPENSYEAFLIAGALGADYIECDVQRTKDGKLIIFHDETPDRTTDAAVVFPGREKKPIGSFTYNELMKLDAGSWFNKKNPARARDSYKGIKICTFEQYIDAAEAVSGMPGLLIELKDPSFYPGIEKEVIETLRKRGRVINPLIKGSTVKTKHHPDMLQTFDKESVAICAKLAPEIPRNYLVTEKGDPDTKWDDRGWTGLLDDAVSMKAEIGPVGYLGWPWYTGKAHKKDLLVIMWTLDADWHFKMFSFFGIDWIITNKTDRALNYYGRKPAMSLDDIYKKYKL